MKWIYNLILELLSQELYFVLLMKSHLQSYPCPLKNWTNNLSSTNSPGNNQYDLKEAVNH